MMNTLLTLLLCLQLSAPAAPADAPLPMTSHTAGPQEQRLWWGLIDPELSMWFSHIPWEEEHDAILWDWSWQGFLAALFPQPLMQEGDHAPAV